MVQLLHKLGHLRNNCAILAKFVCHFSVRIVIELSALNFQTKILTILDSNKDSLLSPYWIGLGLSDKGKFEFKNKSSFSNESWCRNFPKDMKFKKCVYLTPVTKMWVNLFLCVISIAFSVK